MLATVLSMLEAVFGEGARYVLEQIFRRDIRFGPLITPLHKDDIAFEGRRIYQVDVRVIVKGDFEIHIHEAADGSGDGVIFFPSALVTFHRPPFGVYQSANIHQPRKGSISFAEVEAAKSSFTLFIATERPIEVAFVDVRYTVLNEKQAPRRSLLRLPLPDNR